MIGQRIAHYEIIEKIGAGGMGKVYRARDTKLERDVALKLLPDELTADADRLERFAQEARAASSLDHPNIISIHDIVEDSGRQVIVMQYVAGQTLGELMSERRLPLSKTLDYASQVAGGLARAHAQGIVHRDLKPDNVMVTSDGVVKILDFGLAKLADTAADSEAKTRDQAKPSTSGGAVVGTAPYMSPEQVEGAPLDARSDIFSFGSMLYEMLTGRRAFTGKSTMDILSSILKDEPEKLSSLVPSIPIELDRIVTRALRKEPDRRLQSLADARVVLLEVRGELSSGEAVTADELERARRRPGLSRAATAAIAVSLAGLVGFALWLVGERETPPALLSVPLTAYDGDEQDPALSSTGDRVAFTRNVAPGDPPQLFVKTLEGNALQLTHLTEPVLTPTWSPDDTRIAFITHGTDRGDEIFEIDALGGEPRRLVTGASMPSGTHGLSWSPDGQTLAYPDSIDDDGRTAIFQLSLTDGAQRQLTSPPPEGIDTLPAFSSDGTKLAFARHVGGFPRDDIFVQMIDDAGSEERLTFAQTPILGVSWTGDDRYVVYSRVRTLWKVRVTGGEPEKLPVGDHAAGLATSRDQTTLVSSIPRAS